MTTPLAQGRPIITRSIQLPYNQALTKVQVPFVVVSFKDTEIIDDDLSLFSDFPFVQILDLSNTNVGDKGFAHLNGITALESLIVINTKLSESALKAFQRKHPAVKIQTKPSSKGTINPFTGKPL